MLQQYQLSAGIEPDQQICLIGNPDIYMDYFDWIAHSYEYISKNQFFLKRIFSDIIYSNKSKDVLKKTSRIFLGYQDKSLDDLSFLPELYTKIRSMEHEYILLIGKGDYEFNDKCLNKKPDNLIAIAANNLNTNHPDIYYLPMGRDFRSKHIFSLFSPRINKNQLCHCNYSVNTHPIRSKVYGLLREKSFIKFDHMGSFLDYSVSRKSFYEELSISKEKLAIRTEKLFN